MSILNLTVIGDTFKGKFTAISKIDDTRCIFVSNAIHEISFVYNFETHERQDIGTSINPELCTDNLRITDATDCEADGTLWLLGEKSIEPDHQTPYLIQCKYKDQVIILESMVQINSDPSDKSPGLSFQGIAKISDNEFLLCSSNKFVLDPMNKKYGLVYVQMNQGKINIQPLKLESFDQSLYDMFQFSAMFNTELGIGIMPKKPDSYAETLFEISYQDLEQFKDNQSDEIKNINATKTYNTSYTNNGRPLDDQNYVMRNLGVGAMTKSGDKYPGITSWVYPYLISKTSNQILPQDHPAKQFVEYVDPGMIPSDYDKTKAGIYCRPCIGQME